MTRNICVIGVGNLGLRHYQALLNTPADYKIFIVEPSVDALERARQSFDDQARVSFGENHQHLPDEINLAVIATNSNVRANVFFELVNARKVSNILFEKVLFQSPQEYWEVKNKIDELDIDAWVNCPRRLYPYYKNIKQKLAESGGPISYSVKGGAWGLACNSIHFIDHVEWLTGESLEQIDTSGLEQKVYSSKRSGNIELFGELVCHFDGGSKLIMRATPSDKPNNIITIKNNAYGFELDEFINICKQTMGQNEESFEVKPLYQSELTNLVAEDIINNAKCDLVPYDQSMRQHLLFINALTPFVEGVDPTIISDEKLPIT